MMITFGSSVSIFTATIGSVFRAGLACASDRPELLWRTGWATGRAGHSIVGGSFFATIGIGPAGFCGTNHTQSNAIQAAAAAADQVHHMVRRFFS